MQVTTRKKRKTSVYFILGITGLFAAILGFLSTYFVPAFKGSFRAPLIIHIHGAFAFSWIALFLIQSIVVKYWNFPLHRLLGYTGLVIALGVGLTIVPAGLYQVEKGLAEGLGETAISAIVGVVTTALMFIALVAAGFLNRKKPKVHKRLMLLATIVLLWPAWFRFRHYFPSVPRPDIWFAVVLADSLIPVAWVVDKRNYGKIHPVLLYTGLFIIAEHVWEVAMFDSEVWRACAKAIYNLIT